MSEILGRWCMLTFNSFFEQFLKLKWCNCDSQCATEDFPNYLKVNFTRKAVFIIIWWWMPRLLVMRSGCCYGWRHQDVTTAVKIRASFKDWCENHAILPTKCCERFYGFWKTLKVCIYCMWLPFWPIIKKWSHFILVYDRRFYEYLKVNFTRKVVIYHTLCDEYHVYGWSHQGVSVTAKIFIGDVSMMSK